MSAAAPKRFYQAAQVSDAAAGGFAILLDARALKTPGGAAFVVPTRALAEACAAEWAAQGDRVIALSMPLTQLAFAAIDVTPARRDELSRSLAKYLETDLVCHRAASPHALVERQGQLWDPIVAWAQTRFHMRPVVVTGIIAAEVSPQSLTTLAWEIDDLDDFRCTALAQATELAGSILIGFALLEGRLDAEAAFAAGALDELWSLEHWGEDGEARAKLERLRHDIGSVAQFCESLSAQENSVIPGLAKREPGT